ASRPWLVLAVAVAVAGGLSAGLVTLRLTTDPVELWSAPESRARQEKEFHDRHFGPFLRTNQVIVTAPGRPGLTYDSVLFGSRNFSGVLAEDVLRALLELQETLAATTAWAEGSGRNVSLQDVCYAPLNPGQPGVGDCAVSSVTQYFQNNRSRLELTAPEEDGKERGTVDWHDHLIYCVNSPLSFKDITALELSCMAEYGGPVFPYIALGGYRESEYTEAEALIVTYSLNNFPRGDPRLEWALSWERRFLQVVRDFQRQHRHNLSVTFMAEVRPLLSPVSPLCPLCALRVPSVPSVSIPCPQVESKVTLALGGIAVVLGAVLASMGLLSLLGLPSSLIILEVVPFLVLAVGADNIFIFVQELQQSQREPGETREQQLGRVLAQVAPSMLLCSLSESVCFLLAVSRGRPQDSYLLQYFSDLNQYLAVGVPTYFVTTGGFDFSSPNGTNAICSSAGCDDDSLTQTIQMATRFPNVSYLAIPATSWVDDFLDWLNPMGPCCRVYQCEELQGEFCPATGSECGARGLLRGGRCVPTMVVLGWPLHAHRGGHCVPTVVVLGWLLGAHHGGPWVAIACPPWWPLGAHHGGPWVAIACPPWWSLGAHRGGPWVAIVCPPWWPVGGHCMPTVVVLAIHSVTIDGDHWVPTMVVLGCLLGAHHGGHWVAIGCPLCHSGLGAYDTAVSMDANGTILASRFMAYQRPLRTSQDFTAALRSARALAERITRTLRRVPGTDPAFRVFPYTGSGPGGGGQFKGAHPGGVALGTRGGSGGDIPVSPQAVGISVEFVSHITCAFARSRQPTRVARATEATVTMGSKVVAGVAMTNLPGVVVLAFAKARLIQIFFFRLNLIITL
ncbi:NPC1-like intracellular cholesterol transporter 1, partial [Parus major]|uniref:NPC1-like intracellular cholesterol transporter 1 n=1 Tax=Parus major TaxID=9157 RepID=UPI001444435A